MLISNTKDLIGVVNLLQVDDFWSSQQYTEVYENTNFIMLQIRKTIMKFAQKYDAKEIESQVRAYLQGQDMHEQIRTSNREKKARFIEGPPTMNGSPHAGHLRGRVIKDLWYRFNTLRGMHIEFNGGWDTQGLPIELQAEKDLGVTGGKTQAIQQFGVERIVSECKKIVSKYTKEWIIVDSLLGISLDHRSAYRTFDDSFIEREWKILKSAKELHAVREDYTVIAYCPSCQTSLSHAEVGQGYKETTDPSLYYTVRLEMDSVKDSKVDGDGDSNSDDGDGDDNNHSDNYGDKHGSHNNNNNNNTHLIVWTTMPFTLITDAMVGVHPDEEYMHIKIDSTDKILVVGKTRLEGFLAEIKAESYEIIKSEKGSEMDGRNYNHPLRHMIPGLDAALKRNLDTYHKVIADDFVDVNTGSGLVHIAPANGEEDIRIANERKVEIFSPIDDEVKFTQDAGDRYAGVFVRDADRMIVEDLREHGSLIKIGKIKHNYPHCWRSGHALVWLARRGFFYDTKVIGENTTIAAQNVEYFFEQPKNRFLSIINDRHPWCISRERVWGCPLPVWKCNDCSEATWFYSRDEIVSNSIYLPDGKDFELHKPWIDNIKVRCKDCGGVNTTREDYVLDTWHNSGSAPWSSLDDQQYQSDIPVPFLTEGIDQTRGWAYTLLLESVILKKDAIAPYKSFLFQGHVLDENGQKMSKSKGNVLDGMDMLIKYPADTIRLYFMWKASPIEPLSFSTKEMMSRPHQIQSTLYNLHLYHMQNSMYDEFDKNIHTIKWAREKNMLKEPDFWLVSKLQHLINTVTDLNTRCRFHEAARALDDYIVNVFSQIYVRMTRSEIWNEDEQNRDRRLAIYAVLYHTLHSLDVMMHPLCPHITEYLWQTVICETEKQNSILLEAWPTYDHNMVNSKLESSFDFMTKIISACSAARMTKKLKGRWPLDEAIICVEYGQKQRIIPLADMLREQINVEKISIIELKNMNKKNTAHAIELINSNMPITTTAQINGKSAGPKAKQHMSKMMQLFQGISPKNITQELYKSGIYNMRISDDVIISLDEDDIFVGYEPTQGFAMAVKRDNVTSNNQRVRDGEEEEGGGKHGNEDRKRYDADDHNSNNNNNYTESDSCVVFLSTSRNRELTARGLVKDIARRLQSLRKSRGYNPTDILDQASILDLTDEQQSMLADKVSDLTFLVRVKKISFEQTCTKYDNDEIDEQKIRISVE